mmetsp:Transcript_40384/g.46344  ORF Transcript_40384/g.46344 Transcript_40384/m.46344 type:complete len:127 (-) Transcript_40384:53-433(-)
MHPMISPFEVHNCGNFNIPVMSLPWNPHFQMSQPNPFAGNSKPESDANDRNRLNFINPDNLAEDKTLKSMPANLKRRDFKTLSKSDIKEEVQTLTPKKDLIYNPKTGSAITPETNIDSPPNTSKVT